MVLGVCRRVLANDHDAEDAFQATFLVLVRKAASIRTLRSVGSWLHGVAYRTAREARRARARRRALEAQAPARAETPPATGDDLRAVLDREVARLPEAYRAALVLCDLEGKDRKEVARRLGCPEGTVASRLARARSLLAARLTRQGLAPAVVPLTALFAQDLAAAAVPASIVESTLRAAQGVVAGHAAAAEGISAGVAALVEKVLKAMLLTKLKFVTAAVLAGLLLSLGAIALLHPAPAQGQQATTAPAQPGGDAGRLEGTRENALALKGATLETVDAPGMTISVRFGKPGATDVQLAEVAQAEAKVKAAEARQEVAQTQMDRILKLFESGAVAQAIRDEAVAKARQGLAELAAARAVFVQAKSLARGKAGTRLERLPVTQNARILFAGKRARLADLRAEQTVSLQLAVRSGKLVVTQISAGD
jgi:RNA polymerase sigma factor (sigma-70 family)